MLTDRMRHTVIEVNTDRIITRDLVVKEPVVQMNLSAPTNVQFKVAAGEQYASAAGINWKNYGHWIITEIEIDGVRQIIGCTLVTDNKADPQSGDMMIEATGFMGYPKDIPWLENFNPIAVDPAEVVQRVWAHVQGFNNANLGVEVYPSTTGTQMLPGFGFDGSILVFDFFAMFIRAVDFPDCFDVIAALARDLPLDLFEEAAWNANRTEVKKKIHIAYPLGGLVQENLAFRLGENVITVEEADELDIEPVTDVIVRSWLPGKVMVSQLANTDQTRLRRVKLEEEVNIDSTERAAALAKRKLTKKNIPKSFSKITIDPNHPHAPFGSFKVGDSIRVQAPDYAWRGPIDQYHRVTSISMKEGEPTIEVGLRVEGAFNYDPIDYNPDYEQEPVVDPNILFNGYFRDNLAGWRSLRGQWFRVSDIGYDIANLGYTDIGSVRVDLDDAGERFLSSRCSVTPGQHYRLEGAVKWQEVSSTLTDAFQLKAITYLNGGEVGEFIVDEYVNPTGVHAWEILRNTNWTCPEGINEIAYQLTVTSGVNYGISWWSAFRVVPL